MAEMKLIVEQIAENIFESRIEQTEQDLYIVGCCGQSGVINNNLRLMKSTLDKEQYRKYVTLVNVTVNNNQRLADLGWQDIYNTMYYAEK